jgi:DNA polymerase III subunit delta'
VRLARLRGQDAARRTLERALEVNKVHHAYRFEGPEGVGKRLAADLLAQNLLCERGTGCNECSACRRVLSVAPESPHVPLHPDYLLIQRGLYPPALLGASEATGISVEQIRKIVLPRVGFTPHEGRALVITIVDAHELTLSAANALLKTLEEPPDRTHFILLTSRPQKLPDTIRSRALKVRFAPLPRAVLVDLLGDVVLSDELIRLSQGSLSEAQKLAAPESRKERDSFIERAETAVRGRHPSHAIEFAEARPEGRDELLALLRHFSSRIASEARRRLDPHSGWESRHIGRSLSAGYFEVERAAREIEQNGSPALVLETLILRLAELKTPLFV